ncbi:PIR protein, putative [Plasmodium sp. gorilla clade G1]|nr:PIR protein, putative [Plasmodium sp. gorilla clade G1]
MKVHYINILLFVPPLNILVTLCHVSSKKKPYITHNTPSTKAIITPRTLCECECYAPSNYDNDPEMKEVMENYNRQASQRFKEYDERMNKNRQKCKDQCDKEIQKIILKEKIEKELTEKFSTLDTNITTNDIPTCVCEKSLADKAENFCLKCGYEIGGGVLQASSLLGGIGQLGLDAWKAAELVTAKKLAAEAGAAAGEAARIPAGIKEVISGLNSTFPIQKLGFTKWELFINERHYDNAKLISDTINSVYTVKCQNFSTVPGVDVSVCDTIKKVGLVPGTSHVDISTEASINMAVEKIVTDSQSVAAAKVGEVTTAKTAAFEKTKIAAVQLGYESYITSINASIIAILIIVLVMVIIYLILRYRRKTKMKKKLQYIKLLKE